MPGYHRAQLSAELEVVASPRADRPPQKQVEAAKQAAIETGLAREAGPGSTLLAGGRREVLDAAMRVVEATLDAGAHAVRIQVQVEEDSPRFGAET